MAKRKTKNACCGIPTYQLHRGDVLMYEGASLPAVERILNGPCPPGSIAIWRVSRAIRRTPFVASRTQVRCTSGPVKARGEFTTRPLGRNPSTRKLKNRLMR